tara:strand:+ start:287 stop:916 length:630 start_codon:yes stop_codon:yes gene_type:complete
MNYPYILDKYKIIFVGDSGVGKTSILNTYSKKNKISKATVGTEFTEKYIKQYNLTLQIWDCAGQERFRALTKLYYRGAKICILVFDLTNKISLESIENYWIPIVKKETDESIKLILIGNKCDLTNNIDYSIIWNLCKTHNMKFIETSATKNLYINNIFENICNLIISKLPEDLEKNKNEIHNKQIQKSNAILLTPVTIPEQFYNIYTQC